MVTRKKKKISRGATGLWPKSQKLYGIVRRALSICVTPVKSGMSHPPTDVFFSMTKDQSDPTKNRYQLNDESFLIDPQKLSEIYHLFQSPNEPKRRAEEGFAILTIRHTVMPSTKASSLPLLSAIWLALCAVLVHKQRDLIAVFFCFLASFALA
jgi:hypothetical protein